MIHEYLLIVNADRVTTWKGEVGGIAKDKDAPKPYQPSHRSHGVSLPASASTYLATMATNAEDVGAVIEVQVAKMQRIWRRNDDCACEEEEKRLAHLRKPNTGGALEPTFFRRP
jgi:hypothetical protein